MRLKELQFTALVWYTMFFSGVFIGMLVNYIGIPGVTSCYIMVGYLLVLISACVIFKVALPLLTIFTDYGFGAGILIQPCFSLSQTAEVVSMIFWGTTILLAVATGTVMWMKYSSEMFPQESEA
jgi:cytochrome b subunit of formate dehydrogenase